MAEDARHTHPLMGVVICCTSISAETRSILANKAIAMGATHRTDLTSDVTHLIVGDLDTPKYKYVAKNRLDVKVVNASWVDAMHEKWIAGEDIKVWEYEKTHRFLPLYGLMVSVTNIADGDERAQIQATLQQNGAAYHPDLTRHVTHLIAAVAEGRKYDFARQWQLKVVAPEWLYDSIERGMALDEACYDPILPKEQIGVGARPLPPAPKTPAAGTGREDAGSAIDSHTRLQQDDLSQIGKRKIRENITRRIEGQSQSIWEDIMGQAGNSKAKKRDEWDESREETSESIQKPKARRARNTVEDDDEDENEEQTKPSDIGQQLESTHLGMFAGKLFCIYGFEERKLSVLEAAISSHFGTVYSFTDLQSKNRDMSDYRQCIIVVPEIFQTSTHLAIEKLGIPNVEILVVSYWWLERCLHLKNFILPAPPSARRDIMDFVCFPFSSNLPLNGFGELEITTTGFSGIDATHISKLIKLTGAKYSDTLTYKQTTAVICAVESGKSEKAQSAREWGIPVISLNWLRDCIEEEKLLEFDEYIHDVKRKRPSTDNPEQRKRRRSVNDNNSDQIEVVDQANVGNIVDGQSGSSKNVTPKSGKKVSQDNGDESVVLGGCVVVVNGNLPGDGSDSRQHGVAALKRISRKLGATVNPTITEHYPNVTHYITMSGVLSPQHEIAKGISGCHIVTPEWLYMCQKNLKKVDETLYALNSEDATSGEKSSKKVLVSRPNSKPRRAPFEVDDSEEQSEDIQIAESRNVNRSSSSTILATKEGGLPQSAVATDDIAKPMANVAKNVKPAITELLKLGIDKISSALDKPKRPRGKLQGRATANMSALSEAKANSRENSFSTSSLGGSIALSDGSLKRRDSGESSNASGASGDVEGFGFTQFPPQSQVVSYADPEAQRERKRMIDKLNGLEASDTPGKSAKEVKGTVVQDAYSTKRTTRSNQ
ncbi:BRCT domain-containing protein [Peziza echinospora]|nr:BRCT domain-containing protein [Peziza echinospora]